MRRLNPVNYFVPILVTSDGTRHIIPCRDGAPLCGAEARGEQRPPALYIGSALCPGCKQKHAKKMLEAQGYALGWEAPDAP